MNVICHTRIAECKWIFFIDLAWILSDVFTRQKAHRKVYLPPPQPPPLPSTKQTRPELGRLLPCGRGNVYTTSSGGAIHFKLRSLETEMG